MSTSEKSAPTMEPMLSINELATLMNMSRRTMERLKSSGKLPAPDLTVGKMVRWKPETVRRWIDGQAGGR